MAEITGYIMATGTPRDLEEYVNRLLSQGYVPLGNPMVYSEQVTRQSSTSNAETRELHNIRFCQAMVKYK